MKRKQYTVKELKEMGWQVTVRHARRKIDGKPTPKGGTTSVVLVDDNNFSFFGLANCSDRDTYDRKLGVKIALGRAMKWYKENKSTAIKK